MIHSKLAWHIFTRLFCHLALANVYPPSLYRHLIWLCLLLILFPIQSTRYSAALWNTLKIMYFSLDISLPVDIPHNFCMSQLVLHQPPHRTIPTPFQASKGSHTCEHTYILIATLPAQLQGQVLKRFNKLESLKICLVTPLELFNLASQ